MSRIAYESSVLHGPQASIDTYIEYVIPDKMPSKTVSEQGVPCNRGRPREVKLMQLSYGL